MKKDFEMPVRKCLSHTPPVSVSQIASDAVFFVTLCVDRSKYAISGEDVGRKGPLTGNCAVRALCALQHYVSTSKLGALRAVIMPDHIHLVLRASVNGSYVKAISSFKAWMSKNFGVAWQRGFFDHRLRNDESFYEKFEYVAMNPVRKGLCGSPSGWPYAMTWE